jgi:uncharacterized phage protein (TIGR01671 family)
MKNRIIRFRVWDKGLNIYLNNDNNEDKNELYGNPLSLIEQAFGNLGKRYILQQFTGLKDKKGKEIYEGDIISFENPFHEKVYTVNFGEGCFEGYHGYTGIVLDDYEEARTNQQDASQWKIVGNVFENPELLK